MSELIKTESFELAIYKQGNDNAEKLVLCLPGRLDTKDYSHMRSHVDYFGDKGYLAVAFDPPGTWESPGDISLYTMTNYLRAINEVIEYFGDKQTAVVGHSRGGSMSLLAGVTNSNITHIACIMGKDNYDTQFDNVTERDSWKEMGYVESYRDLPPGSQKKEKLFKLPYNFVEDSKQYDMREKLSTSEKPKLFVAGSDDDLVTVDVIQETYNNASNPKEFYVLNSGHDYRYHSDLIDEVNKVVGDFLEKHEF